MLLMGNTDRRGKCNGNTVQCETVTYQTAGKGGPGGGGSKEVNTWGSLVCMKFTAESDGITRFIFSGFFTEPFLVPVEKRHV